MTEFVHFTVVQPNETTFGTDKSGNGFKMVTLTDNSNWLFYMSKSRDNFEKRPLQLNGHVTKVVPLAGSTICV